VRIHPERDARVGMSKPIRDHGTGTPGQQKCRRVHVAEVVQRCRGSPAVAAH
jgi:hypothetical protein